MSAGQMRVYHGDLFETLRRDAAVAQSQRAAALEKEHSISENQQPQDGAASKSDSAAATEADIQAKMQKKHAVFWQQQEKAQRDMEKKVKEQVERQSRASEARYSRLLSSLRHGGEMEARVDKMLSMQAQQRQRKAEAQFADWESGTFNKIQDGIARQINSIGYKKMSRKKASDYQKFLDASNKKGGNLYRDIIIESDYDPLQVNRDAPVAKISKIQDPMKRTIIKDAEEKGGPPKTGAAAAVAKHVPAPSSSDALKSSGRATLNVLEWGTGKIEATPHGHFAKVATAPTADELAERIANDPRASRVHFDHYNVVQPSSVVDLECSGYMGSLGKRCNIRPTTPGPVSDPMGEPSLRPSASAPEL